MLSPLAFELPALVLGLFFGSFLNVCISRLPEHRSVSRPRSHCPGCRVAIAWHDNIPLFSWILLRARCRACSEPISPRYPLVELALGLWFAFLAHGSRLLLATGLPTDTQISRSIDTLGLAILGFLLLGLLVMDWQTHTLPDAVTITGAVIGFVLTCCQALFLAPGQGDVVLKHPPRINAASAGPNLGNVFVTGPEALVLGRLFAILGAAGLLLLIRWLYLRARGREGLGLGDTKLLAMIAAFLGFRPAILALFLGVVLGSAYALIQIARRRADAVTAIPLGSFLALGGLLTAAVGEALLTWYKSLL